MNDFDGKWGKLETRMLLVPGKEVLSELNKHLQSEYRISLSVNAIVGTFNASEVPRPLAELLLKIEEMRCAGVPEQPTLAFETS